MANFIFNQGAKAAIANDIDWVNTPWELCLYDNTVVPTEDSLWPELSSGIIATVEFPDRAITTTGAASGSAVTFVDVSPTEEDGTIDGFVVRRPSDDLLLAHVDQGFDGISANDPGGTIGSILGVRADVVTFTFTLTPGANNENAWFRL